MTEDLNVFPNARSRLFGEGEDSEGIIVTPAVAGLSGNVVLDDPVIILARDLIIGTSNLLGTGEHVSQSFTINYSKVINKARIISITETSFLGETITVTLRRGTSTGTIIASQTNTGPTNFTTTLNVIETDRPVGNQLYTVTASVPSGQLFLTNYAPDWNGDIVKFDVDDSHVGSIDTVAIAGKQINIPDSHRTHEQAVLPG